MIPYVSTVTSARLRPDGLFLLAPAFYLNGYSNQDPTSLAKRTMIVHGWGDEVVPAGNSVRFACQQRCSLHLLDGDHRLNRAMPQIEKLSEYFLNQDVES